MYCNKAGKNGQKLEWNLSKKDKQISNKHMKNRWTLLEKCKSKPQVGITSLPLHGYNQKKNKMFWQGSRQWNTHIFLLGI